MAQLPVFPMRPTKLIDIEVVAEMSRELNDALEIAFYPRSSKLVSQRRIVFDTLNEMVSVFDWHSTFVRALQLQDPGTVGKVPAIGIPDVLDLFQLICWHM